MKRVLFLAAFTVSALGLLAFLFRERVRVCPECGRELEGKWKYCPFDGAKAR